MPERVSSVRINAFRGVPEELSLSLPGGASLVVLADNGLGKSTIADALEFFFTGSIESLRREGRMILNHVAANPDDAAVSIETTGTLGGTATLGSGPRAGREVGSVETFTLRGRTLSDFVDKTKGEKWRYLFEILGLTPLDELRRDLQQARNQLEHDVTVARSNRDQISGALVSLCPEPSDQRLFEGIRACAEGAGIHPPETLDAAFSRNWTEAIPVRQIVTTAARLQALLGTLKGSGRLPSKGLINAWNGVIGSPKSGDGSQIALMRAASEMIGDSTIEKCPLCGQEVDERELRSRITESLKQMQASHKQLEGGRRVLRRFMDEIRTAWNARRGLVTQARQLGVTLPGLPQCPDGYLTRKLDGLALVEVGVIAKSVEEIREWDAAASKLLTEALPQVRPQDQELVKLIRLVDHGAAWLKAEDALGKTKRAAEIATWLHDAYLARENAFFAAVLDEISERVATIYARLHPDEELKNVAVETWGDKGVELAVDFHGQRHRPPHAVLSESHLNSLGIALFLAMAETFNERLGFLVLDDVVNSFDIPHRGQLAQLLASEYGERQLIVLTHDHVFYQQLTRRAPDWKKIEFTSWTYEEGPRMVGYDTGSLLEKAAERLEEGDVQGAATKGRRALEEILQEACEGMAAPLPFRRGLKNDRREAGELLNGVRRGLKQYGIASDSLSYLLRELEADLQAALNVETHASKVWASREEIASSLKRLTALDAHWKCGGCETTVWTVGIAGSSRCRCGARTFPPVEQTPRSETTEPTQLVTRTDK